MKKFYAGTIINHNGHDACVKEVWDNGYSARILDHNCDGIIIGRAAFKSVHASDCHTRTRMSAYSPAMEIIKGVNMDGDERIYIKISEEYDEFGNDMVSVEPASTCHDDDAFETVYPDADEDDDMPEIICWRVDAPEVAEYFTDKDEAIEMMKEIATDYLIAE